MKSITEIKELLEKAVADRRDILPTLVGQLYPGIVWGEIIRLENALKELN
jgi:hypothetical protein